MGAFSPAVGKERSVARASPKRTLSRCEVLTLRCAKLSAYHPRETGCLTIGPNRDIQGGSMRYKSIPIALLVWASQVLAQEASISTGTGFYISSSCHFVTNLHVVKNADSIVVVGSNGQQLQARVVTADASNDLALLKTEGTKCIPLTVSRSDDVAKGEAVHALGFPRPTKQGRESKFTTGIVSSLSGLQGSPTTFQISTPVQPGNSGGPLLNDQGRVVGVIVAKLKAAQGDIPEGVNYAVKSNILIELLRAAEPLGLARVPISTTLPARVRKLPEIAAKADESVVLILSSNRSANSAASNGSNNGPNRPNITNSGRDVDGIRWQPPSDAQIVSGYTSERGDINYAGYPRALVKAAATGKVVYSGEGLRGYGKVIILKHNDVYLTAYGFNQNLLVNEGDNVQAGQVIAEMGTLLLFEVRKYGKTVDPAAYVPIP